jgi:hypothetical protein
VISVDSFYWLFILPTTLRPQQDALARLETFLTVPYLPEMAELFPEPRL